MREEKLCYWYDQRSLKASEGVLACFLFQQRPFLVVFSGGRDQGGKTGKVRSNPTQIPSSQGFSFSFLVVKKIFSRVLNSFIVYPLYHNGVPAWSHECFLGGQ